MKDIIMQVRCYSPDDFQYMDVSSMLNFYKGSVGRELANGFVISEVREKLGRVDIVLRDKHNR